jgi:hypothetical protein
MDMRKQRKKKWIGAVFLLVATSLFPAQALSPGAFSLPNAHSGLADLSLQRQHIASTGQVKEIVSTDGESFLRSLSRCSRSPRATFTLEKDGEDKGTLGAGLNCTGAPLTSCESQF